MTNEVRTVVHQLGDIGGVTEEILMVCEEAFPIAASVWHQEAKAIIRELFAAPD